ncbi:MAG: hypothetical protein KJ061_11920 [Vicinamibacteraceae bacterium]|nr:hypothetical protein [Vicinamibacteraceae bacterium]
MVLVCAAPAVAQAQRQPRGYRGLFGGNEADPDSRQSLNFTFSVNGGYDDNATAGEGGGTSDPRFQQASTFLGGSAGLSYGRRWDRATLSASASASTRYYQDIPELETSTSYGGGIGLAVNLGPRTNLSLSQSVAYSPYYQFGFLPPVFAPGPGDVIAPNPDLVVDEREALGYASSVNLSHRLSRRGTLGFQYGYSTRDYSDEGFGAWSTHSAAGGYSFRLGQGVSLRLGYGYRRGVFGMTGEDDRIRETHNIDAGVDYSKSLSFSRKTTLSFSTGSGVVRGLDRDGESRTRVRLLGDVALNHQIGRSWTATLAYHRGFGFADGFDEMYFSDNVTASIGGYWGPRTTLSASATWSNGRVGLTSDRNRYTTASLGTGVGFALNRFTNLTAQAVYYRYDFDEQPAPGYPSVFDRMGVRGGVSFWLPLLR